MVGGKAEELVKKVIEMRFENKQFETATAETMKTLNRLQDGCKSMDATAAGLANLKRAASDFSSASFYAAADGIGVVVNRFSSMGVVGATVLQNLTNRVTDFVVSSVGRMKSFASSLFGLESIMGGFSEYEDKMGSIQTIKTNTAEKGTTLEDITKTLEELNHYADQTIYSFKEMTRNIGTFTAAGVSLEDSAVAIKGIANLAAGVGSSPQQAANAMYQLSQALASGTVNLQDWNSVVNAGMGGEYFQNALKETARELAKAKGVAVKEFQGTFRESISGNAKGAPWLTSEVLLETLKKFANDPSLMEAATRVKTFTQLIDTMKESVGSGWTETWEYLIGNLDEAGDFFTMISKGFDRIVGSASESRNAMMKFWHDNGGRDQLIKALVTGFQNLSTATKPIRRAFVAAFPPLTEKRLLGLTEQLLEFVSALKLTDPQLEFLRNASDRVFGALKILLDTFKGLARTTKIVGAKQIPEAFSLLITILTKAESAFKSFIGFVERFLGIDLRAPTMEDFVKLGNFLNDTLDGMKTRFSEAKMSISEFYASFADGKVKEFVNRQAEAVRNFFDNVTLEDLKRNFEETKASAKAFFEQFDIHVPTLSDFRSLIDKIAGGVWNLGEKFQNAGSKVAGFFSSAFPSSSRKRVTIAENVSDEMDGMSENVRENAEKTKTAFDYLIAALDFVIDAAAHVVGRLTDILKPVWELILSGLSDIIEETGNLSIMDVMKVATVFISHDMYGAVKKAMESVGGFGEAIVSIGENVSGFVESAGGVFDTLSEALGKFQNAVNANALVSIAVAVAILSGSVIALSMIDVESGLDALFTVSMLVGEMIGAMALLAKVALASGKLTINIAPIIVIALAATILSAVLTQLAKLNGREVAVGLLGVTVLLSELVGVAVLLGKYAKPFGKGSASLILMAFAVAKLAKVVATLGAMPLDELGKGVGAVGALILFLTAFSAVAASGKGGVLAAGAAVLLLAAGIKILSDVIAALGNLDNGALIKGGIALAAITAGIIGFSYALWAAPVGKLPIVGIGLLTVAAGMAALAGIAFLFSRFSWTSLGKAGAAIGGILLSTTLFSALAKPLKLLALSSALIVLGAAMLMLAVDFKIFASIGLEGLLISLAAFVSTLFLMGVAGALLGPMVPTILALSGAIFLFGAGLAALGAGGTMLSAGLAALGPGLVVAAAGVGTAVAAFIAGIIEGGAEILHGVALLGDSIAELFIAVGKALVVTIITLAGPVAQAIVIFVMVLLDTLTTYMDPLIGSVLDFVDKFMESLIDDAIPAVGEWIWMLVVEVADLLLLAIEGLVGLIPGIGQVWRESVHGLRDTIDDYWDDAIDKSRMKRKSERQAREVEDGLRDAYGNLNLDKAGSLPAQEYADAFLDTMKESEDDISDEGKNISKSLSGIRHNTGDASGRSGSFAAEVDEASRSVDGYSGRVRSFGDASDEMRSELEADSDAMKTLQEKVEVAQAVMSGKFGNGEERRGALERAGYDPDEIQRYVNDLLSGGEATKREMDELQSSLNETGLSMTEASAKTDELSSELDSVSDKPMKLDAFELFSKSLSGTEESANGFSGSLVSVYDSVTQADSATADYSETMSVFSDSVKGASDNSASLTENFRKWSDSLMSGRSGSFDKGEDFAKGYLDGILSESGDIGDASASLGEESVNALAESIDAHSPSRETASLALMYGAGYLETLQSLARPAYMAGEEIGENSVDGLTGPYSSLQSDYDDLFSFHPTITPILDLSDVDSGMAYLQNEFGNAPAFGVKQSWTPDARSAEAMLSVDRPSADVDRIVEEMGYLRDDLMSMGEAISHMQVYLDTGTMVGEMSATIDDMLGRYTRQSIRSGRR